jgi:glyoxylase-like metal-dependent hydrolase (beta-lactamase superfamily II)
MKMQVLTGGRLKMRKSTYFPDADRSEMIELPVSCILLRHAQGNVLFDTGCHPSIAENPEPRWGAMAKFMIPLMAPADNVLAGLKAVGLGPDDIDVVVCSHFHTDHCGCNAFFKKATVMVHALELEAAKAPEAAASGYLKADWDHPIPMKTFDRETDVMGDGRIVLMPLPGHTPGTTAMMVKLDKSGEFLLASDTLSIRENLDRDIIPRNTWNKELCARSFAEIRRIEAAGAKVICGHDSAQWETLRKGLDAYD